MSRNSSENRSSNKQREIALPLPNRAPQLRTAQGIDEACKTVLQQPDQSKSKCAHACIRAARVNGSISLCIFLEKRNFSCHIGYSRGWVGVVAFLLSVEINKVGTQYELLGLEYKNPNKFEMCMLVIYLTDKSVIFKQATLMHPGDQQFLSFSITLEENIQQFSFENKKDLACTASL